MNRLTTFLGGKADQEHIPAQKRITLDEAHQLACRYGRPEIGSAFRGTHAAELKLDDSISGNHYITLRSGKYQSAAENLMECVRIAESLKPILRDA